MKKTQLVGLLLWRAGLLFAGGWGVYESWGWLLRHLEIPRQIEIALGLALTGAVFVMLSLVLERRRDALEEGDLTT